VKLALVLTLLLPAAAMAQQRPLTPNLSCQQARALVASRGAIVLGTGAYTYDRFVRDQSFCALNEITEPAWERTADADQCPIGYRCRSAGDKRDLDSH